MNILFYITICAALTHSLIGAPVQQSMKKCEQLSGVSQELIKKFRNREFVNDVKLKAYVYCMARKTGLMKRNEFDTNAMKLQFKKIFGNHEEIEKIVDKCAVRYHKPIDTAYNAFVCFHKNVEPSGRRRLM